MRATFEAIGRHCAALDDTANSIAGLVRQLKERDILLNDRSSYYLAMCYMQRAHDKCNEKTLRTYVGRIRDYLHMPLLQLPEHITISAPVKDWIMPGMEIDVHFEAGWVHGVVVLVTKLKLTVFWVGHPPLVYRPRSQDRELSNPVVMDKKVTLFRPHEEGAVSGTVAKYDVDWISSTQMTIPRTFKEVQAAHSSSHDAESSGDKEPSPDPSPTKKSLRSMAAAPAAGPILSKPVSGLGKRLHRTSTGQPAPRSATPPRTSSKRSGSHKVDNEEKDDSAKPQATRPCPFDWFCPFMACDELMSTLFLLQTDTRLQTDGRFFQHHLDLLQRFRRGQGCVYGAPTKFKAYYEAQAAALASYDVTSVSFDDCKRAQFVTCMDTTLRATYAKVFTKHELVVISCVLAYPALSYTNIDQKRSITASDRMARGMAFLPSQMESFFHKRLRTLKLIDANAHPAYMEPLSTVVLNSTYCYHQFVTWEQGENWKSLAEPVLQLDLFPACLAINGIYVRVAHDLPDPSCVLYAQVQSAQTRNRLGISKTLCDHFGGDYARVIIINKSAKTWKATVHVFLSIGTCQDDNPICIARFSIPPASARQQCKHAALCPEMFSHLDGGGIPLYQHIPGATPQVVLGPTTVANVSLEYGPNIRTRRQPQLDPRYRPNDLVEQAAHCDGNYFHAKDQWERVDGPNPYYQLKSHIPFTNASSMEIESALEPLFLHGPAHLNSLSFLLGVNANTTLTFPPDEQAGRVGNKVEDTPFGGCTAINFIEPHMGSAYPDPNERPHLYAHSADLRQFPVARTSSLLGIIAAKQRIQKIRSLISASPAYIKEELRDLECALGHFIFDNLATATYKVPVQASILKRVIAQATSASAALSP